MDKFGDPLILLKQSIPWDLFRPELKTVWRTPDEARKSNAGRKPWDTVLMFRLLALQQLYNLSDDQIEYQIRDRLSFMRFLILALKTRCLTPKRCGFTARSWRDLPHCLQQQAFYNGWTRKEAIIKATGRGFHTPLATFDVSRDPALPPTLLADREKPEAVINWHLTHLSPARDYTGALAIRLSGTKAPKIKILSY